MTKLPPSDWRESEGLKRLIATLGGDTEARLVGGAVRDALLDEAVSDIDVATIHTPKQVIKRLEKVGIKAVPTGIDHGTITAVANGQVVEVTTLRRDVETDGRRAVVTYTHDWKEDAARRDFTINALYAEAGSGEIQDYFGGLKDLAARRVRFIGEPLERIAEDHLRILRYFRFHGRFGSGQPDKAALDACRARSNDLMALSRERISPEILKILALKNPLPTVKLMLDNAILVPVLPEIANLEAYSALVEIEPEHEHEPIRGLAALLPPDAELVGQIAKRMRLSNAQAKRLKLAAERSPADAKNPKGLAYRIGIESAVDRLLLLGHAKKAAALTDWAPPKLSISGADIIATGITAGPEVARILKAVEARWIEAGFPDADHQRKLLTEATSQ